MSLDEPKQYLPDELAGRRYYEPSDQGMEKQIGERLERIRGERKRRREGDTSPYGGRHAPCGPSARARRP